MAIESYNENQEQTPKLTEEQKEELYLRCKQKVEDCKGHISTLGSKNISESNKLRAKESFKGLFNEGAKISYQHKLMDIDTFCNAIIQGEIKYQELIQLNTRTRFRQSQFIKESIPMPDGNHQIIWSRKIDGMTFYYPTEGKSRTDTFSGLDDIKTEKIKEEERQKLQNNTKELSAMYKSHQDSEKNDREEANKMLNFIT